MENLGQGMVMVIQGQSSFGTIITNVTLLRIVLSYIIHNKVNSNGWLGVQICNPFEPPTFSNSIEANGAKHARVRF